MRSVVLGLAGLLVGCATPPMQSERVASYAIEVSKGSKVSQFMETARVAPPGPSGFHLLTDGLDAFVARVITARAAEQTIDLQYYLYHNDLTGRLLGAELLAAADRGVRVRMLVDDMGSQGRDRGAVALDRHENIGVRIINPFDRGRSRVGQMIGRLGSVTRRMHNKSFVVDNQVAILGGRNIGDEYFAADPALDFSDFDVMAIGEVVAETSAVFDLYWNHALSYPVDALISEPVTDTEVQKMRDDWAEYVGSQQDSAYLKALRSSRLAQDFRAKRVAFVGGQGEVLFDHPDKLSESRERDDLHLKKQIAPWISEPNQELIIISPYFIPGDEGVRALLGLVDRGVRVRILTNGLSSTDVPIVYGAYARYRKPLLEGGVELYELNQPSPDSGQETDFGFTGSSKAGLHAKTFVFDRKKVSSVR